MLFIVTSCGANYKFKIETPKKTTLNNTIQIAVSEKNEKVIDSVQFFINGKVIISNDQNTTVYTNDFGIGKHLISAMVFYPEGTQKVNNSFEVFAEKAYDIYTYKIINEYPHDPKAYTQGLEYYNGFLYESTGKKGESTLRKVAIETGEVLQQIVLNKKYFGEGITIFNDEIFWLTWQNKKGFIYDLATFTKKGEFSYSKSKEGWGFTHNNSELIKSDGTNKIWFLDPITKKEKRAIQVYTDSKTIKDLNELEYVNGKIYANYWKNPLIAIINPSNGTVEGIANLTGLQKEMEKTQKLADQDEVLNGIAYDAQNNRLFVTGKHWGKLFEIELIKKQ
jgi:glutamine cyclotransferase